MFYARFGAGKEGIYSLDLKTGEVISFDLLLGGLRAAAAVISYELPLILGTFGVVLLAGTLNLGTIVENQAGWIWNWYGFQQPLALIIFFIAATAEGSRTPFDFTEADSEIVDGDAHQSA